MSLPKPVMGWVNLRMASSEKDSVTGIFMLQNFKPGWNFLSGAPIWCSK
eukprot:CAMPEP_0171110748 /NCGR_PEP_ID=MMETSP0766_2-20121228/72480_1 /TAXON_ID=439317 /ORGANISM="Gambierdiscus australes, Strain CAWD 149" /LENGTH=48 /DNA_ID= /DNA_START= /DNA_END= /DNA_ORIENTATION=